MKQALSERQVEVLEIMKHQHDLGRKWLTLSDIGKGLFDKRQASASSTLEALKRKGLVAKIRLDVFRIPRPGWKLTKEGRALLDQEGDHR